MSRTLAEIRAEMARLTDILMRKNELYQRREAELVEEHGHDPLKLTSRLDDDKTLNDASGAAKTCATLAGALAQVIQAELAYERRFDPQGLRRRQMDNQLFGGTQLEPPIATRPQDWAEPARSIAHPERRRA